MQVQSILFHNDWMLTRYLGWRIILQSDSFKIFEKRISILRRIIILSQLSTEHLFKEVNINKYLDNRTAVTVKIIPSETKPVNASVIQTLKYCPDEIRIFHKYTYQIDLRLPTETIWENLRATNRNLCKRANEHGVKVHINRCPSLFEIESFLEPFKKMALKHKLPIPERNLLLQMSKSNQLIFAAAGENNLDAIALVYVAGNFAIYLYGVTPGRTANGAGQILQWEIIKELKNLNIAFYDLGGIPSLDENNGIFKFKKGFGGDLIILGPEYFIAPPWLNIIRNIKNYVYHALHNFEKRFFLPD